MQLSRRELKLPLGESIASKSKKEAKEDGFSLDKVSALSPTIDFVLYCLRKQ